MKKCPKFHKNIPSNAKVCYNEQCQSGKIFDFREGTAGNVLSSKKWDKKIPPTERNPHMAKEKIDEGLIGNEKIEQAIAGLQQEATPEQ